MMVVLEIVWSRDAATAPGPLSLSAVELALQSLHASTTVVPRGSDLSESSAHHLAAADVSLLAAVCWLATSFAPLFPIPAGSVGTEPSRLVLAGRCAPPGGRVGLALDERLLRIAARGTGHWSLETLAAALG
jgi:hypothetical protein